jgi:HEAT repeat protein
MTIRARGPMREISRVVWTVFVCCTLTMCLAYGQLANVPSNNPANGPETLSVSDAVARIKSGELSAAAFDRITEARATEAIPVLEEQFARVGETFDKARIAEVLVKLGDKNDAYWDYLVQLAMPALTSDAPNPWRYDAEGEAVPGPSSEFLAWAKAHRLSPDPALIELIGGVAFLGSTGDRRAIPILRRALLSPIYMNEIAAAKGLAEIQDKDSISDIIAACQKAPAEPARAIAQSLAYFDDPQAQRAVDTYLPVDLANYLRERRAQGHGPYH